jgi:hypothetical protein
LGFIGARNFKIKNKYGGIHLQGWGLALWLDAGQGVLPVFWANWAQRHNRPNQKGHIP